MIKLDLNFEWPIPACGFAWEDGEWAVEGRDELTPSLLVETPGRDQTRRSYAPLRDVSGLFRHFAEVPPTNEGVVEFANQYGCLGVGTFFTTASGTQETRMFGRMGETLERWTREVA